MMISRELSEPAGNGRSTWPSGPLELDELEELEEEEEALLERSFRLLSECTESTGRRLSIAGRCSV